MDDREKKIVRLLIAERDEARAKLAEAECKRDEWIAHSTFQEKRYWATMASRDKLSDDLAEARAIAGELARFVKQIMRMHCKGAGNVRAYVWHVEARAAWLAIRPSVRNWLEGKNAGVEARGGPVQAISLCGGWEGPEDIIVSGRILPEGK
jgi:hypothetical protein